MLQAIAEHVLVAGAVVLREGASSATAAAITRQISSITFTAGAIKLLAAPASFLADAAIFAGGLTRTFTAKAVVTVRKPKRIKGQILSTGVVAAVTASTIMATIRPPEMIVAAVTASSIIARVAARGMDSTLDILVLSFTADAVIKETA